MNIRFLLSSIFAALALLPTCQLQAATLSLQPNQDGTLFEDINGTLAGGLANGIFTGKVGSNDPTPLRRGLFQFDLSAIPAGSTIDSVTLSVKAIQVKSTGPALTSIHVVSASWVEGTATTLGGGGGPRSGTDATWTHRDGTQDWLTAGGDFLGASSASQTVGAVGLYQWTSPTMVADVQSWVNNGAVNFGWLMKGDETTAQSVKVFGSRESAAAGDRPVLTVTYTLVPEPGTSGLLLGLVAIAGAYRRRIS